MSNHSKDRLTNLGYTNQPPGAPSRTIQATENLQEDMNWSDDVHMAEDLQESTQGSALREALLNNVQYDSLSDFKEAFDQDVRYLGAQFHPKWSKASLSPPAHQSGSSDATTTANFRDSSQYTGPDTQGQDLGFRSWYKDQVASSQRHNQDLELPNGQRPSIVVRNPTGFITTPVADDLHGLRLGEESTKSIRARELIQRLCDALLNLNNEWMQKLVPDPDLHGYCSRLSLWALFNAGIRTLQDVYSGKLPNSFTEIFGFMHIAFAFSRVINEDYDSYYWDGFHSDIYLWHHGLSNPEDLSLFARVWDRLRCPRPAVQARSPTNELLYTTLPAPPSELFSTSDIQKHTLASGACDSLAYASFTGVTREALLNTLMEGMVIKGCSNFLNGRWDFKPFTTSYANTAPALEFATMAERDAAWSAYQPGHKPWTPFLKFLVDRVTLPLERCPAIAPFTEHVIDTQMKLQDGLIRTEHELELTLISRKDWSVADSPAHRRFVELVASQCNKAMGNPYWRNNYYIAHLNLVLGLTAELPTGMRQQLASEAFSEALVSSEPSTNDVQASLPVSPYSPRLAYHNDPEPSFPWNRSAVNFHDLDTTTPTTMPATSPYTSPASIPTNLSTYATTIPDLMAVESRSPSESSSLASSDLTGDVLTCDLCTGKSFHGQYRRRSWRRHMEAEHSDGPRIPCPEGCDKTFVPGRADNVKRHVDKYHR